MIGHRKPQRSRPAEARGKIDGQGVKTVLLACRTVQVKQRHPDFQLLLRVVLRVLGENIQQARLSARMVAIGKPDGGFF